jgi:hypothetical protein
MSVTLGGGSGQAIDMNPDSMKDIEMGGSGDQATPSMEKSEKSKPDGQIVEEVEVNGDIPQARFGHTITIVSKTKVVLFGGATGDTGKYSMTGETYMYNILNKAWQKLSGKANQRVLHFVSSQGSATITESRPLLDQR